MTQKPAPWQKLGLNLKMGLRACDEAHWLPLDDLFDDDTTRRRQLSAKADLLDHRHEDVFSALPNSTAASVEVLKMITGHLVTNYPDLPLNVDPSLHPLEAAARLLPEDLLLLAPCHINTGTPASKVHWCLIAGAVCFPAPVSYTHLTLPTILLV